MDTNPGDIVYSKAGRDKAGFFVVMATDGEYALICDGKKRKIDKPKRKKIKHLKLGVGYSDFIANKLAVDERVTNLEVRRELSEFNKTDIQNEGGD
ncbi:MAG: RNA-binding protein [Clostridiaceae bacterium]|nr:RNA-binding protein [Clostridiaceae bacterium]